MKYCSKLTTTLFKTLSPLILSAFLGSVFTSCDWMGKDPAPPLPGERVSVMAFESGLKSDPALKDVAIEIPKAEINQEWSQIGGNAYNLMPPLELPQSLELDWSRSIGSGSSSSERLIVDPIVAKGRIYTMDTSYVVSCFDFETGSLIWDVDVSESDWTGISLGGGISFENDTIFVTTAIGDVVALNFESGQEIWRTSLHYPTRAAPTVSDGKVFVLTLNNTLETLDGKTGEKIWSHAGATEIAGILGSASPAVRDGIVVAPYSSGEIVGLRAETGEVLWSDNLVSLRQTEGLKGLAHIRAHPVIDDQQVYAISHSGRMVALNLETGERLWEQEIGGISAPAVAGDFLFVVSSQGDLICLEKITGKIKWVKVLSDFIPVPEHEMDEKPTKPQIHWIGPLLTQDLLLVTGSNHETLQISPQTGDLIGVIQSGEKVLIPPIVANKALIFVTDNGYIKVLR